MDPVADVRTLDELAENPAGIVRRVCVTGRPMLIADKGKPGVVIIPADLFKDKYTALQATCELADR